MGSSSANYSGQINDALTQANQPKSNLAKQLSQMFSGNYQDIFSSLAHSGQLGNAFPGFNSGAATPGQVMNGGGVPTQQNPVNQNPTNQNPNNQNPTNQNPTNQNPQTGQIVDYSDFNSPQMNMMSGFNPGNIPSPGSPQGVGNGVDAPPNPATSPFLSQPFLPQGLQGLFPAVSQSTPNQGSLNQAGPDMNLLQGLLRQNSQFNPSAQLMNSGLAGTQQNQGLQGLGLGGLQQALQGQIGNLGNLGAANLPQLNLGDPNLQAANPSNINPGNATLQTGLPNPQDSAYYDATSQLLNHQLDAGRKDLQARFGASGGSSRGTPAAYAEAQYNAAAIPQLASALGSVRQSEIGNQLQASNQGNSALLQARQQDIGNAQQNVGNQLQAAGLNNNSNLQARQQNLDLLGLGQSGALQNQSLANQAGLGGVGALGSIFGQDQGNQLQNYLGTLGANTNQLSALGGIANQAGNQNLGQSQLGSQNYNNALSQLFNYQNSNNQNQLGQNTINAQNSQFNAGQQNSTLQNYMQMLQAANQQQIQNQFTGNQNIAQILAQFGLSGIPGGSANVNLGAQSQSGMQQAGGFLSGLGSLF